MDNIKVIVASRREIFREGLAKLLENKEGIGSVHTCDTGLEVIQIAEELQPDVILIDIEIKDEGAINAISNISTSSPNIKIIAASRLRENRELCRALKAGARCCIFDNISITSLIKTLALIVEGDTVIPGVMAVNMIDGLSLSEEASLSEESSQYIGISNREMEVLSLLAKGCSNRNYSIANEDYVR